MASPNLADRWYYTHDSERLGPFTGQQLRDLADAGQILLEDTVWKSGVVQGVAASKVKHLFTAVHLAMALASDSKPAALVSSLVAAAEICPPAAPEQQPIADGNSAPAPASGDPPAEVPGVAPVAAALAIAASTEPTLPGAAPAAASTPRQPPKPVKKGRAVAGKGITITSQDGKLVKFKKKCPTCGHEDSSYGTVKFAVGSIRVAFFCPKCKKQRHGEIRGYVH